MGFSLMEDKDYIGAVTMLHPSPSLSSSSARQAEDPHQSTDSVYKDDDQVSIKSGSFFSKDKNKDGGSGLSLTRHSLTSLSKRRPFSRKPSSCSFIKTYLVFQGYLILLCFN